MSEQRARRGAGRGARVGLVALLAGAAAGCTRAEARTRAAPPVPVRVATAAAPPTRCASERTGMLRADRRVELGFKVGGYVTQVASRGARLLEPGERVKQGEVLAAVRASDYAAKVAELASVGAQADATLAQARLDEARARKLLAEGAIAPAEYDSAKNRLDAGIAARASAGAGQRQADLLLADTRLSAPFDATVLARHVEPGQLAAPGAAAFALGVLDWLRIDVAVPEAAAGSLRAGDEVPFHVAGATSTRLARVHAIVPQADARTRLVPVELRVENADGALRDGRPVTVLLGEACPAAAALVPVASVVRAAGDEGASTVWVTTAERGRARVERRRVVVGGLVGDQLALQAGVRPGESVVTAGATHLAEGVEIEVLP